MLSQSWFSMDDLHFMSMALTTDSLDAGYLTQEYAGHVMPAGFALNWFLAHHVGYSWGPWGLVLWALQVMAALGMLRLLVSMFGARWRILLPLTGYLFWVLTVPAGIWWAAGINQLPLQVALVFGLTSWLGYLRTRRIRHMVSALAWIVFSLAFYEKSLIMFGVYALVAFCWFCSGPFLTRVATLWRRYRLAIIVYGLVAGAYLAWYVTNAWTFQNVDPSAAEAGAPTPSSGSSNVGPVTFNLIGNALMAATVGGPWAWRTVGISELPDSPDILLVLSWVLVALVVAHALRTRTMAKRSWLLVLAPLALNIYLIVDARAKFVGPTIALEYRYQTEVAVLLALAGALAFWPLLGADEQNRVRPDAPNLHLETPKVAAVAAGVVALGGLWSTVDYTHRWHENNRTPAFYHALVTSVEQAPQQPVPVIDRGLPTELMWGYRYPENMYSHVFKGQLEVTYVDHAVDSAYVFGDDGTLTNVEIQSTRTGIGRSGCGWSLGESGTSIDLDGPLVGEGWWTRIGYLAKEPIAVTITAGPTTVETTLPAGLRNFYLKTDGNFEKVTITGQDLDQAGACVGELSVGLPQPGLPLTHD